MSHRPTTRSKNKRHKPDDDARTNSEILRRIHLRNQLISDDVIQLYMIWKPVCQGCRLNTKDNPNCFCALIPPPNGSRKSGLWQKTSEIILSLGPDPSENLRASTDSPAGLTNLGATCYANSILQCLYMNQSFREGVFSVEPEVLKEQPVLDQLTRLFAQLHASKMAYIDSAQFIKTLELDNSVQQDSHEFLTLLFSLLEQCLRHSKVSKAQTIIQDLFSGKVSHVTTCSKCGKDSEASSKTEDFYGLELNIKGLKNLDESLDDYLSVEELQGDNQYNCEACGTRVDATRSIKLRSLPAVLNFQLKRCVFIPKTTTKKKITSPFCFPGELDMRHRLSDHSQSELLFDLSAVLIHKGSAVNSGHYIAHIKDQNTDQWWEFDDEHVTNLGQRPFREGSSNSDAKTVQPEPVTDLSCSEPTGKVVNGNHIDADEQNSVGNNLVTRVGTFSSSDAYMLMYIRRNLKSSVKRPNVAFGGNTTVKEGEMMSTQTDHFLPSHICEELALSNSSYLDACKQYKLKKDLELDLVAERRQEVRLILSEAPVQSLEEPYFWISTDWLRQWADSITTSSIDNTLIQCLHGKVPLSKIGSAKRISAKAWTTLFPKYGGGPTLAKEDYCGDCILERAHSMVCADSYRDQRTSMKELAEGVLAGNCLDGTLYYVSKTWLHQWLRRKNIESPCDADAGPTASIRCPHGELMPEQAAGAKRLLVPENLWQFFYETSISVKPDDLLGCSVFPSDSETCALCSIELTEVAFSDNSLREFKLKQRQNHEKLVSGKSIQLLSSYKYYLLPSSWLSKWRSYINASGKTSSSIVPETLDAAIDLLKCEKHSRLLERPPDLICRRNLILQKAPTTDRLTIITDNDWKIFCEDWGASEEKGISAEIDFGNSDKPVGMCEEVPLTEEHMGYEEANGEAEARCPVIKTYPEICESCIGERESCELMEKLNYCNEDICVCFVRGKEPPKSIVEGCRISKRSRRTSSGNSINFNVSGSTSIYQLKMLIWESFGVVKENQILHKGSNIIDGESATLADVNILPGDTLWVTDSEIHENRDIAEEISNQKMDVQPVEEGFRGSLLTSNIS